MFPILLALLTFSVFLLVFIVLCFKLIRKLIKKKLLLEAEIVENKKEFQKILTRRQNDYENSLNNATQNFSDKIKLLQKNQPSGNVLSNCKKDIISLPIFQEYLRNPFRSFYENSIEEQKKIIHLKKKERITGDFSFNDPRLDAKAIESKIYHYLVDYLMRNQFIYYTIDGLRHKEDREKIVTFSFNIFSEKKLL